MASGSQMFSYAQAAKGLAPAPPNGPPASTVPTSEAETKNVVPSSTEATSNDAKALVSSRPVDAADANVQMQIDSDDKVKVNPDANHDKAQVNQQQSSVTEADSASDAVKETSPSTNVNGTSLNNDKILSRTNDTDEQDKGRDGDDDWEKVSVPSVVVEKEYKAAPLPTVNVWHQRREAQEAKQKERADQRQAVSSSAIIATHNSANIKPKTSTGLTREESKRRQTNKDPSTERESAPSKRNNSGVKGNAADRKDQSPSQGSPRSSSKQREKSSPTFPAAGDVGPWPTPENAIVDERRRSIPHEKADKPDGKGPSQKKWIQMPFVPTAKFETPLPPAAAARRGGGRASNRGRDSANRSGQSGSAQPSSDKHEGGNMGPPPIPKPSIDSERGRKGDGARNQRAASVPTQVPRSVSHDGVLPNSSKKVVAASSDQPEQQSSSSTISRVQTGTVDESSATDGSRSSSRHQTQNSMPLRKLDTDVMEIQSNPVSASTEPTNRVPTHQERHKSISREAEPSDRSLALGREWSRSRTESGREKNEVWKERRERGPDRGRGGYRSRGNHSGYGNHPQGFTAPLPQNGFEVSKSYSIDGRSRQSSQPYTQGQPSGGSRNNPRSQSIPLSASSTGYFVPMQSFPQSMSPAQMEMNYASYSTQLPSGIMDAMPYSNSLNTFAIRSMVISQLEYYFSINNLCKDLFLRRHMDSQGFVSLSVIAGFKRIQALTEGSLSHEEFRSACQSAPGIEFVTGDDGVDKLRARGIWKDFVLPREERLPSAQNDGPSLRIHQRHQSAQFVRSPTGEMIGLPEVFNQAAHNMRYPPIPQFDGSARENYIPHAESPFNDTARRSSNTSPLGHAQSPLLQSPPMHSLGRTSSNMTNGHHRSASNTLISESVFPDNKIFELKVVVRDTAFDSSTESAQNANIKSKEGSGNQKQMDNYKHIQFGQSSPVIDDDHTPFWTKHGHKAKVPEGPSFIHEDYLSLLDQAFAQREEKQFDGSLTVLYPFWSSFLVENFNVSMYQDFVRLATEEAVNGGTNGQSYLLSFYETLLKRRSPISDRIAHDVVDMFHQERHNGGKGSIFETLRTVLRNGATDFKTVKRITILLTPEEKAELGV